MQTHGKKQPWDIVDEIMGFTGLYHKVFGNLLPGLIYNQSMLADVEILENVYGFDGVNELFTPIIERRELKGLSKIIFRFNEGQTGGLFNQSNTKGPTNN